MKNNTAHTYKTVTLTSSPVEDGSYRAPSPSEQPGCSEALRVPLPWLHPDMCGGPWRHSPLPSHRQHLAAVCWHMRGPTLDGEVLTAKRTLKHDGYTVWFNIVWLLQWCKPHVENNLHEKIWITPLPNVIFAHLVSNSHVSKELNPTLESWNKNIDLLIEIIHKIKLSVNLI